MTWWRCLRWAAIALALALLVPPLVAATALFRLSTAFLRGRVFEPAAARHLARAGHALLWAAALGFLARPGFDLLVGWSQGGGSVAIELSSADLWVFGGGLLLLTLGRVLEEAGRLARENAAFV